MRKLITVRSRMMTALAVVLATAALCFLADAASAGKIQLNGTWKEHQITSRCVDAGGTHTDGTGSGGYGCKTSKGEVSCDKNGKCTGECQACGKRLVNPLFPIRAILRGPIASR